MRKATVEPPRVRFGPDDHGSVPVVCRDCGRAYGRLTGETPYTTEEAGLAAIFFWDRGTDGTWSCGLDGVPPHG